MPTAGFFSQNPEKRSHLGAFLAPARLFSHRSLEAATDLIHINIKDQRY